MEDLWMKGETASTTIESIQLLHHFQTLFTKLSQVKYTIPDNIQAMIVLSHLP